MITKIISQIETYLNLLNSDSKALQSGEAVHQWMLNSYLKNEFKLETVMSELKNDKEDFLFYLYEIEIRLRALRDMLDPFNSKAEEIRDIFKESGIIPYRITELEDINGLCYVFKKKENIIAYFELYHDLDMGYIVEDTKNNNVIKNIDVKSVYEFIDYMKETD